MLARRPVRAFSATKLPTGPGVTDAGGRRGRSFSPERQQEGVNLFEVLADHIRAQDAPVVIASYSDGARERLSGILADFGIDATRTIKGWNDVGDGVNLAVLGLENGFEVPRGPDTPGLTVISEQDVLGDRLIRRSTQGQAGRELPDRVRQPDHRRPGRPCRARRREIPWVGDRHRRGGAPRVP